MRSPAVSALVLFVAASPASNQDSPDAFRIRPGFAVELVHDVTAADQGSWVSLTVDPRGRLIASDQSGPLYRVTPSPIGASPARTRVEVIDLPVGNAQGLCWTAGSLYAVVASNAHQGQGLYRIRDTDGDDRLDEAKMLRPFGRRRSEHGPHAVIPSPDGKSLVVVAGNHTEPIEMDVARIPPGWGEDDLLPRLPANLGSEVGTPAPGGWIARTDLDGRRWEWIAMGLRNAYDLAFNRNGELFTYDADAEYDLNTPWYRSTRLYHVVSGAEFGWRNGGGKWPAWYPDVVPPVLDMGLGSPTGLAFGTGAKFPRTYQNALFACDWSYGRLYAVHLAVKGASYGGKRELFLRGFPMPVADLAVSPKDGALYFVTGGRRTRSRLYRIVYRGDEATDPAPLEVAGADDRALRRRLEVFHGRRDPAAVDACWPHLGHKDRAIRYAARVALEHQPARDWQEKALGEERPDAALAALLALARTGHRSLRSRLLGRLGQLEWKEFTADRKLALLRAYQQTFIHMGRPEGATVGETRARFESAYPSRDRRLNAELCKLLVYLQSPTVAHVTLALLEGAPTQEEQLEYLKSLRHLRAGWTRERRERLIRGLGRAAGFKGGRSLQRFVEKIRDDVLETMSEPERAALGPLLDAEPPKGPAANPLAGRKKVRVWTVKDLAPAAGKSMKDRGFDRGRALFAATCSACHRFRNEGGAVGPDLTGASGRFGVRDLLEATVEPSKAINDQFAAVVVTRKDGKKIRGQIVNSVKDQIIIALDLYDPSLQVKVERKDIALIEPSETSMMPTGLLDTFKEEEILDLLAYLISGGNRDHPAFRRR